MASSPAALTLSRHRLAAFLTCQRRFQLRYLEQYPWPSEPQDDAWQVATRRGEAFHRLLQRHLLGFEVDDPGAGDPQLRQWWHTFRQAGPLLPAGERLPELTLTVPVGAHRLTGRFDLLVLGAEGVHLYDWKTTRPRPAASLRQDWQTRLYLALAVEGSSALYPAEKQISPEQVTLTYWFVQAPEESVTLDYDGARHAENWADIVNLVTQIDGALEREGDWPLTTEIETCARCIYQVVCGRQEAVAALAERAQPRSPGDEETGERVDRLEPSLP